MSQSFNSFEEFWPFYVCEHRNPKTRLFHFLGTAAIIPLFGLTLFYRPRIGFLIPVCAYGLAWVSHFFIEKNRPATFSYPLWSIIGDFKMFWLMCIGKMEKEVLRCEALRTAHR